MDKEAVALLLQAALFLPPAIRWAPSIDRKAPPEVGPATKEEHASRLVNCRDALRAFADELDAFRTVTIRVTYGSRFNLPDTMILGSITYTFIADQLGSDNVVVNASTSASTSTNLEERSSILTPTSNPSASPAGCTILRPGW